MTTVSTTAQRRGLSGPWLMGLAFTLTTLLNIAFEVGDIVFTNKDPHRPEGPIVSIEGIALYGAIGLVVALAVALPMRSDPARAGIGAIVLGALSLATVIFFWSGAPAVLGAGAAWLAGLTTDQEPQRGTARGFGIVGLVIVVLTVVATVAGHVGTLFTGS